MLKNSKTFKFFIATFVFAVVAFVASTALAADYGTTTLRVGSRGPAVVDLQVLVGATADGAFGPLTEAKVKAWQANNGLVADGLFGNKSKAVAMGAYNSGNANAAGTLCPNGMTLASNCTLAANAQAVALCPNGMTLASNCGVAPAAGTVTTGPLVGTDGTIGTLTKLSQYNAEEVGAGQNDVKVLGFDLKASKDGDIELKSIKLSFDLVNGSGSTRLEDYVDTVSVWMGSTKIGSASSGDFNKDATGAYSKTITLSNAVSRSDVTNKFYVTVDAVSNMDSGDIDSEAIDITVDNIRYVDGSGVVSTDTTAGDLGGALNDVSIAFVSYATAAGTKFKILTDSSSPTAGIVVIDDTANTDNQVLLKGKIKVEGTSDLTLNSLPITLTTVGATAIDGVTGSVTLVIDGQEFSESTGANCSLTCVTATTATVTFDNLNLVLDAGSTVNFTVMADINDIEVGSFEEGDSLLASLTANNLEGVDVENSQGDQVVASDKSGTLTGKAQEFRTQGIALSLVSTSAVSSNDTGANNDTGTFKIVFKVTAVGETAYVATYTPLTYYPYTVDLAGIATTGGVSAVITNDTDTTLTSAYNWQIDAGESETLTLTVNRVHYGGTDGVGLFRAALAGVLWASTDDNTPANTYSSNLDSFKTGYVSLN